MKTKSLFAALLLSSAAYAQTAPAPTTPPATTPQSATPAPFNPTAPPQNAQRGTINQSVPAAALTQDRVRKRQTVMDGQASAGVETTTSRRPNRLNDRQRPAREAQPTTRPIR